MPIFFLMRVFTARKGAIVSFSFAITEIGLPVVSRVMRKPAFLCENKCADQLHSNITAHLISAFVFATQIVQFLYFLNPKFQASSRLLWLISPVCVGPGRHPEDRFPYDAADKCLLRSIKIF